MLDVRILIVEDEGIIAEDLAGKLDNLGYAVCGNTPRGEDALKLARELRPDLVLMDIRLAGQMDGVDAAERIRQDYDIPVIFLTAHSDRATLDRAKRAEPFGFILKPFEELEIDTHIEMALYKHQAERTLRENEARWRVTLSSIGDGVISCDTDCHVTFLNPIAATLTGWALADALGQPITRVLTTINEQTGEPAENLAEHVLREHRILEMANHTALFNRDGHSIPIEDSAAPITDAQGRVTGVVIVFHDVTAKRRAEEAMERLASFPQLNPSPIVEVDLAGEVYYCNPAAEKVLPDLTELDITHPWLANWETITRTFTAHENEIMTRDVLVGDRWYQQTMHFRPRTRRVRIYGMDITNRKQAEVALQHAAADLKRSNQELEQFAYVASHDLQEPLRAVVGYISLIECRLHDQLDDKTRSQMEGAVQGAARMQQLITDLLALSRVGSQGKPFAEVSLETVFAQAMQNIRASVQESGAQITRDPLPTLKCDAMQLAQLFQNLLGNAIKFRGTATPEIQIGAKSREDGWVFSVRDNGIGIDPQCQNRIFQIFQRLHTRKEYPGTGIGLAICKKIVERHGGSIWVDSQPGEGATFYFNIPEQRAEITL